MYSPDCFNESDQGEIMQLIKAFPLATLINYSDKGLSACHIPLLSVSPTRLIGHIALENNLHRTVSSGADVLLVFTGEDSYISPNWYPTKAQHHRHVPTWNYQAVHIHGKIHFSHGEKEKRASVGLLTRHHESQTNAQQAWKMSDAPRDYIDTLLGELVALHVDIERIEAVSKVSQNRDSEDFKNVKEVMQARGCSHLSQKMSSLKG